MHATQAYHVAYILLWVIGGIMFVVGFPYAMHHFNCTGWCSGQAVNPFYNPHDVNTIILLTLEQDDIFELFLPFGAIQLAIGLGFYALYLSERAELVKQ